MSKGKRAGFEVRKLLFAFAAFSQVINWILMSIIVGDFLSRRTGLIILGMIVVAIIILCDKRRNHVSWTYVILVSAVYFLFTGFIAFKLKILWCLWAIIPELCVFIVLAIILYRLYGKKK